MIATERASDYLISTVHSTRPQCLRLEAIAPDLQIVGSISSPVFVYLDSLLLAQVADSPSTFHATMDWQGQKLAEQLMQILLLAFAVVAFATGYVLGSFQMMVLIYASGVVFTTLVTVPNWPFFNRNPLKWLDPSEAEKHPKPQLAVPSKKKSSKK